MCPYDVSTATVLGQHYVPAKDRRRAHMLELRLSLPPLSTSSLSVSFRRAHLKWTEHKPDAHHGFYIKLASSLPRSPCLCIYCSPLPPPPSLSISLCMVACFPLSLFHLPCLSPSLTSFPYNIDISLPFPLPVLCLFYSSLSLSIALQ